VGWFCTNCCNKSLEFVLQTVFANNDVESPKIEDIINFFKKFLYDIKTVIKNMLFIGFAFIFKACSIKIFCQMIVRFLDFVAFL
jgi:hypothetical protein